MSHHLVFTLEFVNLFLAYSVLLPTDVFVWDYENIRITFYNEHP